MSNLIHIGIIGQSGFLGKHLFNRLNIHPEYFEVISIDKYFSWESKSFIELIKKCDVIIFLAAINRCSNQEYLYQTNIGLIAKFLTILTDNNLKPTIFFSSSTQELSSTLYGKSKEEGRKMFEKWATINNSDFVGLIIPNIFGPFCKPNYNSFIATFCYQLTHNQTPLIITDNLIELIYIDSLCDFIINEILKMNKNKYNATVEKIFVPPDFKQSVSEILTLLKSYKEQYYENGIIPSLKNKAELDLFNTFRSYIDLEYYFPFYLKKTLTRGGYLLRR